MPVSYLRNRQRVSKVGLLTQPIAAGIEENIPEKDTAKGDEKTNDDGGPCLARLLLGPREGEGLEEAHSAENVERCWVSALMMCHADEGIDTGRTRVLPGESGV